MYISAVLFSLPSSSKCNLFQFLEEPSLVTERNGVIVDDLAVPFKKEVADGKGAGADAGTTTAAESTKEG